MSVLISISRASLSLGPLVLSGYEDANALGVSAYQEPGRVPRLTMMPDSRYVHGSEALAFAYQQGVLSWEMFPTAVSEQVARNLVEEVMAAVAQFDYTITTTLVDASPQAWTAQPGRVTPLGGRGTMDLTFHDPLWAVEIPVYPLAAVA